MAIAKVIAMTIAMAIAKVISMVIAMVIAKVIVLPPQGLGRRYSTLYPIVGI